MSFTDSITKIICTFIALMILLGLTYFLAHIDLGPLNVFLGIIIAVIKASLVGVFFMNLSISDGIHRVFAVAGVFMLAILLTLALSDFLSRGWLLMPGDFPPAKDINVYDGISTSRQFDTSL